jgi:signal transduction histidine kinase
MFGLYMVTSLARLMGRDMTLASKPGHGACFTAWLPFRVEQR